MDDSIWTLPQLCRIFADNLFRPLGHYPPDLYGKLFVARDLEATQLLAKIGEIVQFGGNVMVVGDRGVGKSSFLHWFLERSRFAEKLSRHHCKVIDIKQQPLSLDGDLFLGNVQEQIVDTTITYLDKVHGRPCHEIRSMLDAGDVKKAYRKVAAELNSLTAPPPESGKLLLFIDDIDYVDQADFLELLLQLKPFLAGRFSCIILAARRPAYNALIGHSDHTICQFFEASSRVQLTHLQVKNIMDARMFLLGSEGESLRERLDAFRQYPFFGMLVDLLIEDDALGSRAIKGFPFTDKQVHYIQETSNGNVSDILSAARVILECISENSRDLERTATGQYIIGRERLISAFSPQDRGSIRLHNLHERQSYQFTSNADLKRDNISQDAVGNSLYVCILEALNDFPSLNETRRQQLRTYGFSNEEILEGISELLSLGMLEEKRLRERATESEKPRTEYELTNKGKYYIEYMIHWDEYIAAFGVSQHHVKGRSVAQRGMVQRALLEFLAAICIGWGIVSGVEQRVPGPFRVSKASRAIER